MFSDQFMFSYYFILFKVAVDPAKTVQPGWEANQSQVPMHTDSYTYSHLWASSQSLTFLGDGKKLETTEKLTWTRGEYAKLTQTQ